ncbi:MAG: glycosyltransferase family 2 protein [Candidatus Doudnabacteria bacterium]|nr:glycosyltransferase family 2 protein [Candidatus Doudnabacteria bacterium]
MDLSIVILSYRSKKDLERLLPSVFASQTKYSFEVIVVDNGSNDGTYEWVQAYSNQHLAYSIKLIRNTNTGFSAGNNLGIKQASGKYILLLNPDTEIESNTFEVMLDFMESHPDVGISGCKVLKPDGSLDLACRRKFPNPWNSFKRLFLLSNSDYNLTGKDVNQEMEIDSVMGAFLLIRNFGKSENQRVGETDFRLPSGDYLDEEFFMYGEDLDLCWRCKEAGWKVWYYPKTSITHYKGSSSAKIAFRALKWFHDAMWIFYRKHYKNKYPFFFNWLVFLGIYARLGVLWAINSLKSKPRVSS